MTQPSITATSGRVFACSPAAVLAIIIDEHERFLLMSHPNSDGKWEVVNGALDADETILEGVMREIGEEAGDAIRVRELGVVHAYTFRYDNTVQYVISICLLFEYQGGEVIPGDDMTGSEVRWFTLDELESGVYEIVAPRGIPWIFRRALDLYRLWNEQPPVELQPAFDHTTKRKYEK